MKNVVRTGARILAILAGGMLLIIWYLYARDYHNYFVERKGELATAHIREAGEDSLFQKLWLTLENTDGFKVECGMLVPQRRTGHEERRYPAIVLAGGKATGKYAIDYAFDIRDVIIVSPDYPYEPRESYTFWNFLADVPAMRRALVDMVPSTMLLTDYLHRRDDVDTSKLVMLGYSFGAPLVPVVVAYDKRFAVAAMVYGGGDLGSMIRHNVNRYEKPPVGAFVGLLSGLLLRPVEPMRYVGQISPTPLLMINGTNDEQIPRENTLMFYDRANQPKKIVWLESQHVNVTNVELTRRIIHTLGRELIAMRVLDSSIVE